MASANTEGQRPPQQPLQNDSWAKVLVTGSRTTRQVERPRERGEGRGGPFDAHNSMETNQPQGNGQQKSRQVPMQSITQEVFKDTDSKRHNADTDVSTETVAMGSDGRTLPEDEGRKGYGVGKQISAGHTHRTWNGILHMTA